MNLETFTLDPKSIAEGFTQSEISTMSNCAMKWHLTYNLMLRKRGSFSWALIVGTAIHTAMEQIYATKGERWSVPKFEFPDDVILTNEDQSKEEYWQAVCQIMLETYCRYYKDDFKLIEPMPGGIEIDVDINFEGLRLRGKIDLYALLKKKEKWMFDHKTTSRITPDVTASWDFRFQFMFYMWLLFKLKGANSARGMYINALRKPQLRQKDKESLPAFINRIRGDMSMEPEKYFYREPLRMTKDSMEHFEKVVLRPKLHRLKLLIDPKTSSTTQQAVFMDMNTDHCNAYNTQCQFLPLCSQGWKARGFEYALRPEKHAELEAAAE